MAGQKAEILVSIVRVSILHAQLWVGLSSFGSSFPYSTGEAFLMDMLSKLMHFPGKLLFQ